MLDLEGFSAYLLANELSPGTVRMYQRILREYSVYNAETVPDKESVMRWKEHLCQVNKPQTVNLKLAALAKYCKFAGLDVGIRRVTVQKRTSICGVITREEVDRLLGGLDADGNFRFAAIVRLMAKTGGRISEVLRFRKCDLLRGYVDMKTKGKVRRIYLPKSLADELEPVTEQLRNDEFLCMNKGGGRITARGVGKMLRRYAEKYGIPPENAHPHAFRHYFAIEFLRRNPNISLLADILGHSGVNTTMIYLRMTEKQQQAEINKTVDW